MKKNEFRINVTEKKIDKLLEYVNDMQEGVNKNRNNDNHEGFLNSMHYRDGFLIALTILGIDWDYEVDEDNNFTFTRIKKNIYKD
jgi:hypothetical protein